MNRTAKSQETEGKTGHDDLRIDRRQAIQGGGLLMTAAAGGAFAPTVKASTQAKALLSSSVPVITSVDPLALSEGDLLTINGNNFGDDIELLCVNIRSPDGSQHAILRTTSATDTQVTARLQTLPPGMTQGDVELATGIGEFITPTVPPPFSVPGNCIFWRDNGTPFATFGPVTLVGARQKGLICNSGCVTINPGSSSVSLVLSGVPATCEANSTIFFDAHFDVDDSANPGLWPVTSVHYDAFVDLGVDVATNPVVCWATLCQAYTDGFSSFLGLTTANDLTCGTNYNPATNELTITLILPGGLVFGPGFMCSSFCS